MPGSGRDSSGAGCLACWEDEARVRVRHKMGDNPPSGPVAGPVSQTCSACGRTYARRLVQVQHEQT